MDDLHHESQFYIPARTSLDREGVTRLKHGDTFAVFDAAGDLLGFKGNTDGVYHRDTRHLSHFEMRLNGARPLLLSSSMQTDNAALVVDLTNPDFFSSDKLVLAKDLLHIQRLKFIWQGAVYERYTIHNFASATHEAKLSFTFGADFADLFEARGQTRARHGNTTVAQRSDSVTEFSYRGLDDVVRSTRISFWPIPEHMDSSSAAYHLSLAPGEQLFFMVKVACNPEAEAEAFDSTSFLSDMIASRRVLTRAMRRAPLVETPSDLYNDIMSRAHADLTMLVTDTPHGPYPFAGIPWFSTYFGRDALITALFTLWFDPQIACGVLNFLAAHQAKHTDAFQDAEPGKILHEVRQGEMAALREIPFGFYYGSIDSTPLFVVLAGAYFDRTRDLDTMRALWPALTAALGWIENYGDRDGDGFVEYARQSDTGLQNQGWKDSYDSISHENGDLAEGPIALCEVQAYVYGAWLAAARIGSALGEVDALRYEDKAATLRERFEQAFWQEDMGTYALALDGHKKPCRVSTSNAGHVLLTGLASHEHAEVLSRTLLTADMFSGWGIRTLSTAAKRYNPMSYHNGSVWPHDNGIIALGLSRYGLTHPVLKIFEGLSEAARFLPLQRLPELFCGFPLKRRVGPTGYPVACAPQAWAAATPIALTAACLGLSFSEKTAVPVLTNSVLPRFVERIDISGLKAAGGIYRIDASRGGPATVRREAEEAHHSRAA